ncbi:MAG: 4Fe-4S binding protein [bacterium]
MKVTRNIIEINEELCDGCGLCVPSCAEGAIQIVDGKARLVSEKYCDGLGACLGECPQGALKVTEREAEDFDAAAVVEYLGSQSQPQGQMQSESQSKPQDQMRSDPQDQAPGQMWNEQQIQTQGRQIQRQRSAPHQSLLQSQQSQIEQRTGQQGQRGQIGQQGQQSQSQAEEKEREHKRPATLACGCPSTHVESFKQATPCPEANRPVEHAAAESGLSHWPVQIRLVPPSAPFLKGAHLLVLADCTAVACPALHRDFLPGKAVLMGCPKFDNGEEYVQKFSSIFKAADIRRITVLMMEVPCCSGLSALVEKGLTDAGEHVPVEKIIISTRGKVLGDGKR